LSLFCILCNLPQKVNYSIIR